MRYYILQDNDYHDMVQVDSVTRSTSGWSSMPGFISLDTFRTDCVRWGNSHDKFSTHNYKVLLTSAEKITRQTNPEFFI